MRIALFASGSGSNVENILRYFENDDFFVFPLVVSNKVDAYVHQRAKSLHVLSFSFSREDFLSGEPVLELLRSYEIDAVVLAGFLLKIPPLLIKAFPGRIINIHPALLPKFGGKGMYGDRVHRAVVEAGETESGISIHYVNENYDEGNIIFQASCSLAEKDTPEDVATKVQRLEHEHFPRVIESLWRPLAAASTRERE